MIFIQVHTYSVHAELIFESNVERIILSRYRAKDFCLESGNSFDINVSSISCKIIFLVMIIGTFALLYFLTKHNVALGQTLHHSKKLKVQVQCCKVLDRNLVLGMFTLLNEEYSPHLSLCFVPCIKLLSIYHPLGRLFAMQKGIKIDSKGKDSRAFLLEMMDQLEKVGFISFNSAVNTVLFKDKQVISSLQ